MTTPDDVTIIKAGYELKIKAGSGGFSPVAIAAAERRLEEAKSSFPTIARRDIQEIEEILLLLEQGEISKSLLWRVYAAGLELKLNSQMFQYPLVTAVSDSLCKFTDSVSLMSDLAAEVIALHLRTLKIAIEQGPRAITEQDKVELLSGLEKASEKATRVAKG